MAPRSFVWGLYYDAVTWPGPGVDFFAVYHSGIQVRRSVTPYHQDEVPPTTPYYFRYLYAPGLAHSFGRLISALPPRAAYITWVALIETSLLLFAFTWWRQFNKTPVADVGLAVLLLNAPLFLELHAGQFTLVATSLATTGVMWSTGMTRLSRLGGGLVAVGAYLKLFPLWAIGALLGPRARPAFVGSVIAAGAVVLGAWLFPSESADLVWLNSIDDAATRQMGLMNVPHVIRLALDLAGRPPSSETWRVVPMTLLITVAAAATIFVRRQRVEPVTGFCLIVLLFLVMFYRTAEHHYSAVILLGSVLLARMAAKLRTRTRHLGVAMLVLLAVPTSFALIDSDQRSAPGWVLLVVPMMKIVPALALALLAVRAMIEERRS